MITYIYIYIYIYISRAHTSRYVSAWEHLSRLLCTQVIKQLSTRRIRHSGRGDVGRIRQKPCKS